MHASLKKGEELELLRNVNPAYAGRGNPSDATRGLIASDLIDQVLHEDGVHWHASLTKRGTARLSELQEWANNLPDA